MDTLPGLEAGTRTERTEWRIIVNPDRPAARWISHHHTRESVELAARQYAVPIRIERRTVVTYTDEWREG
ncbi:hypothetical protein C1I95_24710 [Micromonospora craterilacus]|uniref:Uncharacterized protein n=1 Tax=Micromonospora craterilacus TaxID=1655439 RepID=A0A2W2EKS7_9ACTN|nr:hypothetical protein [Micromonospora craterilacus]PZG12948.1 hypothetical protein C1I95_24710 [Micromonospora craterilacus]